MLVNFNANHKSMNPQFQARFSQKDVKTLMNSAKEGAHFMQDVVALGAERMTAKVPEKAALSPSTMYGRLNAILDHVDSLKGKVMSLVEEKLPNGGKAYKIMNENNEVLGKGARPMAALDDAFVLGGKQELAPKYWGDKLPDRVLAEKSQKLGEITEQDVLAKALN